MKEKGIIFDIQRNSFVDGPGIRTTVFFKGCNLRCAWCHNPESQYSKIQMMLFSSNCTSCGKCENVCPSHFASCSLCGKCALLCPQNAREISGKEYTVDDIIKILLKDKDYYTASGGGVTFSGGECMLQIEFLRELLKECKKNGLHTAIDTAGNVPYQSFEAILPYTDMFLYDIKCIDTAKHKQYTGVGNSLILENLKKLLATDKRIWVRIPVIASVNDSVAEAMQIREVFEGLGYPEKIELLPYHSMGEHKYQALGLNLPVFNAPDRKTLENLKNILKI